MPQQLKSARPRPRWLGALVSFFIPGLGSILNGSAGSGLVILVFWLIGIALTIVLVGFYIMLVAWIWGLVDGALSADRWNRRHGITS
jgi:TM2 domain-containing membrane protein YozV